MAILPASANEVTDAEAARIKAIESVLPAVVAIYGNERAGGGSGVLFDPAGYALTNHHVIAGSAEGGWAGLSDGKLYRWKLIGTDPGGDLAIIKLEGKSEFPAAPLGDSDTVRVGDWALAMGNPFNLAEDQKPTVTLGIVSGVKRFQEGSGLNQLIYGNCIQVDSSINPGNSGGPLFDLRGEIIGINGRGSFEERGRVNVGLGYAISSNQIRNFIPELLATKIVQHGTLDAVFSNREAGVICHTLNLDAPASKAGLALGDKLLAFEGIQITNANQFTNLLSTYPAGWPAELTFEHEGQPRTIHVRLTPLPYERIIRTGARPREQPPAQPPEKPPEGQPEQPPDGQPPPRPINERPPIPLHDAGKIRDPKLNEQISRNLIARWRADCKAITGGKLTIESDILQGDAVVGQQLVRIVPGMSIEVEYSLDGKQTTVACDREVCWQILQGQDQQKISRGKALLDPHFAQALALAALFDENWPGNWGTLALDGADKAGDRLCYRLSLTETESSERLYFWLSVQDIRGKPHVELVKTGVGLDDDEPIAGTLFQFGNVAANSRLPSARALVRGLAESPVLALVPRGDQPANAQPVAVEALPPAGPFASAIGIAQQRTVKIYGAGIGRSAGYATGLIVGPQGEILTGQGIFLNAADLRVTLPNGTTHRADVLRKSAELQSVILKIDAPTPEHFELSRQSVSQPGDWIIAVSNAFKVAERHEPLGASVGVLGLRMPIDARRGVHEFPYEADAWLYDAITSNPGAEGGAIVSADGALIGMIGRVIESSTTRSRLNYAVPTDLLAQFAAGETLEPPAASATTSVVKADLGIRLFALGGRRGPAYIDRVVPGGPAAAAGLKTDDLIVSIGGEIVRDTSEFKRIVESLVVGREVIVEVKRRNELLRVTLMPVAER